MKTEFGAKGLAYIKWSAGGEWESPIVKFFSDAEEKAALAAAHGLRRGRRALFRRGQMGEPPAKCSAACACAAPNLLGLTAKSDELNFLWVVDFPLLAFSPEDNHWVAVHHPFTRPKAEDSRCSRPANTPRCARSPTTWCSMAWNSAAAPSESTRRICRRRCSKCSASTPEEQQMKFAHLLRALSALARRRTAGSPSGSTGWSC